MKIEKEITEGMLATATKLIVAAQRDLGRDLSPGQMRDLLADNTKWRSDTIKLVVEKLPHPRDTFIAIGSNMAWGKGSTEGLAVANMTKEGGKAKAFIAYQCTARTYVNDTGGISRPMVDPEAITLRRVGMDKVKA